METNKVISSRNSTRIGSFIGTFNKIGQARLSFLWSGRSDSFGVAPSTSKVRVPRTATGCIPSNFSLDLGLEALGYQLPKLPPVWENYWRDFHKIPVSTLGMSSSCWVATDSLRLMNLTIFALIY